MADSTSFELDAATVMQSRPATPRRAPTGALRAGQFTLWIGVIVAAVIAIAPMALTVRQEMETWSLMQASDETIGNALARDWSRSSSPDYVEALSELSLQLPRPDNGSAIAAARLVTKLDPSRAYAWASIAHLETARANGKVNEAAIEALTRSMDACPLCAEDLIRWRFNFVLANWNAMPEALRRRAFEQADLLRWIGPHAEFLAEMRVKARQNGIPFDAYRAAVTTPVRTWDIDPNQVRTAG
jgi:hypothetical protein